MPRSWVRALLAAWAVSCGLATDTVADIFSPDVQLKFALAAGQDDFFYEDAGDGGSLPRRLLGRLKSSVSSVSLVVRDEQGNAVFEHQEGTEVNFTVDINSTGTYSFGLSNRDPAANAVVTLAVGRPGAGLHSHYLRDLQAELAHLEPLMNEIQGEAAYVWVRRLSHLGNVESLYARVLAFCFMKLVVLVSMACFQAFYVEGLFHPETQSSKPSYKPPERKSQLFSNDYHRKPSSGLGSLGARRRSALGSRSGLGLR